MRLIVTNIKIFISTAAIIAYSILPLSNALAAGPTTPVGPTKPVGPTTAAGPTIPTGPTKPVGPTTAVGPTTPVGPTQDDSTSSTSQDPTILINSDSTSGTNENISSSLSTNNTSSSTNNDSNVSLNNDVNIDNNTELDLNTGRNSVGSNSEVGAITTGSINGTVTLINIANTTLANGSSASSTSLNGGIMDLLLSACPPDQIIDISVNNNNTGSYSENINVINDNNVLDIVTTNNAEVNNIIEIEANTGDNLISNNTKIDSISTGDINLGANIINLLNLFLPDLRFTLDIWNVFGNLTGDVLISGFNNLTGNNSENINSYESDNKSKIDITQNATTNNNLEFTANTGNNSIGDNTVIDDITTGDSIVSNNMMTISNIGTPTFYIFNVFGNWDGTGCSDSCLGYAINEINSETGANSNNVNSINSTNQSNTNITNNATANNNLMINANTGNNTIEKNTVIGSITTGSINISQNVINILNSFSKDVGQFALKMINIFGNWHGNPADDGDNDSTSDNDNSDNQSGSANTNNDSNQTPIQVQVSSTVDSQVAKLDSGSVPASNNSRYVASTYSNDTVINSRTDTASAQTLGSNPDASGLILGDSAKNSSPNIANKILIEFLALILALIIAYGGYKLSRSK